MSEQNVKVMISEELVQEKIIELAEQFNSLYKGESLHLVGILKGSVFFLCELAKHLTMPVTMDFMKASSDGNSTESSRNV